MNAFDKNKKLKKMPSMYFIIVNTEQRQVLTVYSADLKLCQWENDSTNAAHYATQIDADNAINAWGLGSQSKYIGSNPPYPPHP